MNLTVERHQPKVYIQDCVPQRRKGSEEAERGCLQHNMSSES